MKQLFNLKSIIRLALVTLCLLTVGVGNVWARSYEPHFSYVTAAEAWSTTDITHALVSPANNSDDEMCIYMWVENGTYFAFNTQKNNSGVPGIYRPKDNDKNISASEGAGDGGVYTGTKAWHYTGSTGLVKINAAQSSNREWGPYIWIDVEDAQTAILKGTKIMFYFGTSYDNHRPTVYLKTGSGNPNSADQEYFELGEITKNAVKTYYSVAYASPGDYYISNDNNWGGHQFTSDKAVSAGALLSVGETDYKYAGSIPHFATETVNIPYGKTNSGISATASASVIGNEQTLFYYYTTDEGETFTKFDPTDISGLSKGTYTVYALAWDGHVLVRSDNSVEMTIADVTISLNANGGTAGSVTEIVTTYGTAASTGNIRAEAKLPTKAGNGFDGYWTQAVGGIQVISEWGEWKSSVVYWTDADGKWIRETNETLYAHWVPVGYYVVGDFNNWQADSILSGSPLTSKTAFFWKNTLVGSSYKAGIKVREVNATPLTDVWYGCDLASEMNESHTTQTFYSGQKNVSLEMKYNGVYQFEFNTSTKELSVTIPIVNQLQIYESDPWDIDRHRKVDWRAAMSEHKVDKTVVLKKATTYNFKAVYLSDYWGKVTDDTIKSSSTTLSGLTCTGTEKNMHVLTTLTGNYKFELDTNAHTMTVTYPTARRITCTQSPVAAADAPTIATTDGSISIASSEDVCDGTSITFTHAAAKTGYTWSGWYNNAEGTGVALGTGDTYTATASGALTVYAVYTETDYTVTVSASTGGVVVTPTPPTATVTAHIVTTAAIAADSTNAAYKFTGWTSSSDKVVFADAKARSTTITTTEDATVTANFEPRFVLLGSRNNNNADNAEGMPSWTDFTKEFAVEKFATLGDGDGEGVETGVLLTRTCQLLPNRDYKFQIFDRVYNKYCGLASSTVLGATEKVELSTRGDGSKDVLIWTVGYGDYVFKITNISETNHYPTVKVERQASSQLTLGVSEAAGGTVIGHTNENSTGYDVGNTQFYKNGSDITFTATPAVGCSLEGWYSDNTFKTKYTVEEDVEIDGNMLTLSSVSTNKSVYAKWKPNDFVIYRTGDKAEDPRSLSENVETYTKGEGATFDIDGVIEYRMKVGTLNQWYSLCLPFDVDSVCVWDDEDKKYYKLVPYYRTEVGGELQGGHYIIRTPSSASDLALANFDEWNDPEDPEDYVPTKKTPYIIQWHMGYFANKFISFFGHDAKNIPNTMTAGTVPSSENVVNVCFNDALTNGSVAGAYMLEGDYGSYGAWLRLENAATSRTIPPFECYLLAGSATTTRYRVIRRGMAIEDTATGWEDVLNSERKSRITVYTITGFPVAQYKDCSFAEVTKRLNEEQQEGIYILRSDNESVKLMLGGK